MKRLVAKLKEVQLQEAQHKVFDSDGNEVTPKPLVSPYAQKETPRPGMFSPCSSFAKSPSIPGSDRSGEPPPTYPDPESARLFESFLQTPKKPKERPKSTQPAVSSTLPVKLTLRETNTIWLLELPSTALPEDDPQAPELRKQIERYDYLTRGKGKNRKMVDAETQTLDLQAKRKATMTTPIETKSVHTFVSAWDLYDTYEKTGVTEVSNDKLDFLDDENDEDKFPINDVDKFLQSALIMERLLASNNFKQQQAMFTGYPGVAESSDKPSRFQYVLRPLWVFKSTIVQSRSVMAMVWNPANKDLLAVGYGQTEDHKPGLVCCWSTKNPTQPERSFNLPESVTSVAFSNESSRILAVGQQDGTIALLDVATRSKEPYTTSSISSLQHMGPVWCLQWKKWGLDKSSKEVLVSTGQDGQICRWTLARNFYSLDGMWLRAPLHMPCIDSLNNSNVSCELPVQKYLSGLDLSLSLQEKTPTLYVATKEGYLVEVELELQCRRMRKIHRGPVFSVHVSPFCHQVILTAGADGNVCIWSKDSENPLLVLAVSDCAVVGAAWSPSHSTILACVSEYTMSLWDINRKTHAPVTSVHIDCQLTTLTFCPAGRNILVGDKLGNVHVFNLQDMPYAPYMQVEALTRAIPGLKHHLISSE